MSFLIVVVLSLVPAPYAQRMSGWQALATGALCLVWALDLVLLAGSRDDYYAPTNLSRWEYSGANGSRPFLVGAIVVAALAAAGCVHSWRRGWRRAPLPFGTAAFVGYVFATFAVTTGHKLRPGR